MPIRALPGSPAAFTIIAQDPDTLEPLGGVPVFLDRRDQPAAPFQQVDGGVTGPNGQLELTVALPDIPGDYRYRARTPGEAERFRPDTSREVRIEVVAAPG